MATSDKDKVETAIEHLTTAGLDNYGGYPGAGRWIGDDLVAVVVNSHEANGKYARIEVYRPQALADWYDRAIAASGEEDLPEWYGVELPSEFDDEKEMAR